MEQETNTVEQAGRSYDLVTEIDKSAYWMDLNLQLAYAINQGIMTPKESDEWVRGMAAADSSEHARQLTEVWLPKYLEAGESVLSTLDSLLYSNLISAKERGSLESSIMLGTFDSKKDQIAYLQGFISEVEGILRTFEKTISNLSLAERAVLREQFFKATKAEKQSLIAKAHQFKSKASKQSSAELRAKFEVLEVKAEEKARINLKEAYAA